MSKGTYNDETTVLEELQLLLSKDPRLTSEEGLLKNVITELAVKQDEDLIKLLLDNDKIKTHFFKQIDDILIFDDDKFMKFINNKEFLPESYTSFKNKIGLTTDENFLKQSKEVVLSWPYKDCVLEGGQEEIDQKRTEKFHNVILAPDEIDRLLEPKVFSNFKLIDQGEQEIETINASDNLILKGNNLLVLHSLKNKFQGKIKLIYIDPPYNTGNDEFRYNDNFNHSTWLTFMKNRLEIAKELLAEDGAIFVQCDDNEQAYLKVLLDEIFGRDNFRECICVKTGSESGVNAINVMRGEQLFKVKEYLLYYSKKSSEHRFNPLYVKGMNFNFSYRVEVKKNHANEYEVIDIQKKLLDELYGQETMRGLSNEQKQIFFAKMKEYCLTNAENVYALKTDIQKSGDKFKKFANANKSKNIVEEYKTDDNRTILVYKGGMLTNLNSRLVFENGIKYYGLLISDFWWDIGATPSSEGGVILKSGKKSEKMLKRIIDLVTNEGDIVLDFFLGSGSTAAVSHKMGRQYIGIEQLDYGGNSAVIRLKNVINGDTSGISRAVNWEGGGSFIYGELKNLNEHFIQLIIDAENSENLLEIWENMKEHAFLSYKIEPKDLDENIQDFTELSFDDQKNLLINILDMNELYVNYSEIKDKQYNINDAEIDLNNQFYENV